MQQPDSRLDRGHAVARIDASIDAACVVMSGQACALAGSAIAGVRDQVARVRDAA